MPDPKASERIREFFNAGYLFSVLDDGPMDGEIVVLLHGFPQTAASWEPVRERLHRSGFRTLVFDQRGYSTTARPRGRFAYRISALVGDVAALIDALGAPVHLVGHDWGAVVAWATSASRPGLITTLTAVSVPHTKAFLGSMLRSDQAVRSYYMALFQLPWLPEFLLGRSWFLRRTLGHTGMTPTQIAAVRTEVIDRGALTPALNWYRAIPFASATYTQKVTVPTTYVWSTGDTALGRCGAELCERYVTAPYRFEAVAGSHWIPEERPDLLSDLIVDRINGRD